jgi:hypothetical protein
MVAYCQEVRKLEDKFEGLEYWHILRDKNEAVHELAKMGSSWAVVPPGIFMQQIHEPSLPHPKKVPPSPSETQEETKHNSDAVMAVDTNSRTPFIKYLTSQKLPEDSAEAGRLKKQLTNYLLIDGELYRKSVSGVLMRCILADEGTRS